jgi:hypothetical protein
VVLSSQLDGDRREVRNDYGLRVQWRHALSTIDQQTASAVATGTAKTRYVHPDHLGSTNVVTDENANVVQTMDYYPYGSTRISVSTSTKDKRQFIGQFTDDSTLSYLQARYQDLHL